MKIEGIRILQSRTPALAQMIQDTESEFSGSGLAGIRALSFLPADPQGLEKAISEIKDLIIRTEEIT